MKSRCLETLRQQTHPPIPSPLSVILSELCPSIKRQPLDLDYITYCVMEKPSLMLAHFKHTVQALVAPTEAKTAARLSVW